jgi:putative copper resistance protein D
VFDPLILVRFVHVAATLLAGGTVSFIVLVVQPAAWAAGANPAALLASLKRMIWIALAVAMLSGVAWIVLVATNIQDVALSELSLPGVTQVLGETRFGIIWIQRMALAAVLGVVMRGPAPHSLQLSLAGIFVASLALTGHAGATPGLAGDFHLISDVVHLLAAGGWLGALPGLALLLTQARREPDWGVSVTTATQRFSRLGIVCVVALLASGAVNSWNLLGGPGDLVTTAYGRLILLKIALFAAMVCLAAINRFRLTPNLPAPAALRALARNSLAEIALGLSVLLVVGALGATSPTVHNHGQATEIPPDAAFAHIHTSEAMADVTIDPGRVGTAIVRIRLWREDFTELSAKDVRLSLEPQSAAVKTAERAAQRMVDGVWQTDAIALPQSGIWTLRVTVSLAAGEPIVLDAPVVIGP